MNNFGPVFKKLRKEKGLSLKEVASETVSVQFLSNFENGKSDIKLSNFLLLLSKLHLTMEEFFVDYHDDAIPNTSRIFHEFSALNIERDHYKMKKRSEYYGELYKKTGNETYNHIRILFAFRANANNEIPEEDKNVLRDHLLNCQQWGLYELRIIATSSPFFSKEEMVYIHARELEAAQRLAYSNEVEGSEIILNQIFYNIRLKDIERAKQAFQYFIDKDLNKSEDKLSYNALGRFLEGLLLLCDGKEEGRVYCEQYLDYISTLPGYKTTINQLHKWVVYCENIGKEA